MDSRAPPEKLRYTVIYYTCEAVKSADQLQEVINMADNEKFTIDRSDLTSGNYDTAEQTTVMTDGEAPVLAAGNGHSDNPRRTYPQRCGFVSGCFSRKGGETP